MTVHADVTNYIKENILNSDSFTALTEEKQKVAINTATSVLYLYFKSYNPKSKPLPLEAVAYQTVWEVDKLKVRDSDLGIASQSIEGMTQTFRGMDRTVAPEVRKVIGGRVGSYSLSVSDTRKHMYS